MLRILAAAVFSTAVCIHPACAEVPLHLQSSYSIEPARAAQWFCRDYPAECKGPLKPATVKITPAKWRELSMVNIHVNSHVKWMSDTEHFGTTDRRYVVTVDSIDMVDRWTYPTDGYGDCEDFALEKKRRLIEMGWPRSALLITIVKPQKAAGKGEDNLHAVLLVRTDRGDYVLDSEIGVNGNLPVLWYETSYDFQYRQSQEYPDIWEAIRKPSPVATQ